MAESPSPASRSISLWWSLLLLPAGLLAGWVIGQIPGPGPRKPAAATSQVRAALPASVEPRHTPAQPPGRASKGFRRPEPAPVQVETPVGEPQRAELSYWTTFENAKAESRRNGKPVLIDFNADWCPPCQTMKRQVFDDLGRGRAVRTAVIPVSVVDRFREDGRNPPEIEDLQRRYGVEAFPTLIVFSPESGRTVKAVGFGGADRTVEWITEAAKAVR